VIEKSETWSGGFSASSTVVDLTLLLAEELPGTWPGHMPYQHKTFSYFEEGGSDEAHVVSRCGDYQTRWLLIDEHTGTHVDAPAHFVPKTETGLPGAGDAGSITVDKVPLKQTMGPAVVIDVSALTTTPVPDGQSPLIEVGHIRDFEAEHGPLQPGDIVLFRSRWDTDRYVSGSAGNAYAHDVIMLGRGPGWPAPSTQTIEYLLERGVRCIGTDGVSMGPSESGRAVHVAGLGNGAVFIEALTNLAELPVRGSFFLFAPLRVARGTGAPGRALAFLP